MGKKPRFDCLEEVNFAHGQVKMEVWWSVWQGKLAPVVLLVIISNLKNFKTYDCKMSKTMN